MRTYSKQMQEYGQDIVCTGMKSTWQYILNMMGRSNNPLILTGEVMDQETMLSSLDKKVDGANYYTIKVYQSHLAYYFGDYEQSLRALNETKNEKVYPSHFGGCRHVFFTGLISFALAHKRKS